MGVSLGEEEPFHIVLIDIKDASNGNIHCIKKPFERDHFDLQFIAISYRWGELFENIISTGVDYTAHVTSFGMKDFYRLCKMIINEPTLKNIKYIWVDAICVDQYNEHQKKITIYRMTDIYHQAAHILSVPDLHYDHLVENTASSGVTNIIRHNVEYLYHMISGDLTQMNRLDKEWMDGLQIPQGCSFRKQISSQDIDDLNDKIMGMKWNDYDDDNTNSSTIKDVDSKEKSKLVPDSCKLNSRQLFQHILRLGWKREIDTRWDELEQSIHFLENLIQDWSNRTWVINEYHIAKEKGKVKFWFVLFSQAETPLEGLPFFDYFFEDTIIEMNAPEEQVKYPLTAEMYELGIGFKENIASQLIRRPFLDMILASKATKPADRFYAILPQSRYKQIVKHKSTVSRWQIKGMDSVRLKLLELMTTMDQLNLLFFCSYFSNDIPVLPSFATRQGGFCSDIMEQVNLSQGECNFEMATAGRNPVSLDPALLMVLLIPKRFYVHKLNETRYYDRWGRDHIIWSHLGLNPDHDALVEISMPLILRKPGGAAPHKASDFTADLQVVGCLEKNCWVMHRFDQRFTLSGKIYADDKWTMHQHYNEDEGFRVY